MSPWLNMIPLLSSKKALIECQFVKFDFQMAVSKKRFSFGKFYVEIR